MEGVIVWEWFSDHGRWRPYSPEVSLFIEENFGKVSVLSLGSIESSLAAYEILYETLEQRRISSGNSRPIRRRVVASSSPASKGVEWQWQDDSGWSQYDLDASQFIEDAYTADQSNLDLSRTKCHLPYTLDFTHMLQFQNFSGFQRSIQRVTLKKQYPKVSSLSPTETMQTDEGIVPMEENSGVAMETADTYKSNSESSTKVEVSADSPIITEGVSDSSLNISTSSLPDAIGSPAAMAKTGKSGRKGSYKRPATRKAVGSKGEKRATVAWSSPGSDVSRSSSSPDNNDEMSRTVSVPTNLSLHGSAPSSSQSVLGAPASKLPHSATTSQLSSKKSPKGKMVRSKSTPCSITANAARRAGPHLSPVMTAMTSLLISTAIPVTLTPSVIPSSVSGGGIRPVEGVERPSKRRARMPSVPESPSEVIDKYATVLPEPPNEDCAICFERLGVASHYHDDDVDNDKDGNDGGEDAVMKLNQCGHCFHKSCLHAMYSSGPKDGSIQCPSCKTIYGIKYGNQPPGIMDYHVIPLCLPGFPGDQTIRIIYNIPPGIQGADHPHPGQRYSARGFPRHCYLPDTEIGRRILKLLIVAWDRRLIFTIGTSATTGESNTVIWNEIHHKTELGSNRMGHGYPDPRYFDNVLAELHAHGVTDEESHLLPASP